MSSSLERVERWGIFEASMKGPEGGNPFLDIQLSAEFRYRNRLVEVDGFYDGEGVYRIRLMPDTLGIWRYITRSNYPDLDGKVGEFTCVEPSPANHGPVHVHNTYHFVYADGTPYYPIGTTCYAWIHQGDVLEEQTLATLKTATFNKLRMCVFPKHYVFNRNEPVYHPFERGRDSWDFTRFNPRFFQHLEQRIGDLIKLGIEADIILFHPYDHWGYATMDGETDDRYLRYILSRLVAFRNVWWSMANEYDMMQKKTMADWDRFFRIVQENDPYQHPRSIHNWIQFYDHAKPWVTHCSIQSPDFRKARDWQREYRKPVLYDECVYEGNIEMSWGSISAQEMVHRFWLAAVAGCYAGHGETYEHPEDILWWSKGGVLHGQSPERIAFLRRIFEEGPAGGLEPIEPWRNWRYKAAGKEGEYYLLYFGVNQPSRWSFNLPEGNKYQVEVIDTWNMIITPQQSTLEGKFEVKLPGEPYMAMRIRKIK